jgi:hypothetical protein
VNSGTADTGWISNQVHGVRRVQNQLIVAAVLQVNSSWKKKKKIMHKILDYHSKSHRIFATFFCLLGFRVHMVLMMKPVHCGFANLQAEKIVFCGSLADREKHSSGVVVESCNTESSPIAKQFHDMPRSSMLVYVSLDLASADSVSDDYMPYMLWQFPTNVTGWICSTLVTSSLLKVCLLRSLIFPFSSKISVADLLSGKEVMLHSIQSISNC